MEELTHKCRFCKKRFNGTVFDDLLLFQEYMDVAICPDCVLEVKKFMKNYFSTKIDKEWIVDITSMEGYLKVCK